MKDENRLKMEKSISKILIFICIIILIVIVSARYVTNEEFRGYVNTKILKKELVESTLTTIEIDTDKNPKSPTSKLIKRMESICKKGYAGPGEKKIKSRRRS